MNKTALKIFSCFIAGAVAISLILLAINFVAFALTATDTKKLYGTSPRQMLEDISHALKRDDTGFSLGDETTVHQDIWCILIDENGDVVWNQNMPTDIPTHYSMNDVASMTRWYLNDYPVYVRCEDYGLLVLGYPKNSLGKYGIEYSMEWFHTLPERLLAVLIFNTCLATLLACLFGMGLYHRLGTLMSGIRDLKQERPVHLKERGLFRELAQTINDTSHSMERKNRLLLQRDNARSNWIAGISHDIRTPLSVIMGYSDALAGDEELQQDTRVKAKIITGQSLKIKKLVEDLNLISSLEYDMQPAKKKPVKISTLLRRVVADLMNTGLSDAYEIELDCRCETATVLGDEQLLERAIFNLLNNSITHNESGCRIFIKEELDGKRNKVVIDISDNGKGVCRKVLDNMDKIPKTAHGLGLPMAYKIVTVHAGSFRAWNSNGFCVHIELPVAVQKKRG